MKRDIFIVDGWLHQELMNWTRWAWRGAWPHPIPAIRCGSLEGRYIAPPEYDETKMGFPQRHIRPNERNARKVQAVFETLPELEKFVLLAEYPQRERSGRNISKQLAADRIGVSVQGYDRYLQSAAQKVAKGFEESKNPVRA